MKLGIIGSGMIVKDFFHMMGKIPEIEVNAILGTKESISILKKLQIQNNVKEIYTDFEKFITLADIDTVYVAVPNHLHYSFSKKALEKGKHVICEKPFTLKLEELRELRKIAERKQRILLEAITTQYLPNYLHIKSNLKNLGEIKLIECNYSQYSSRYNHFKQGIIEPAFDLEKGGGALRDINLYNLHFVIGLLGTPSAFDYHANIERNIDTSGILFLEYPNCKVVCIGAKDSASPPHTMIQGISGSISTNTSTNMITSYQLTNNTDQIVEINVDPYPHRMHSEFLAFNSIIENKDFKCMAEQLNYSEIVINITEKCYKDIGLI